MAFEIKRNDRRPRWRVQLTANGTAVDLSTATAVRFIMKQGTGATTPKVDRQPMTIVDAVTGVVEYAWAAGDTDTAGTYNIEVEVDWGGTEVQSFPSKGYFTVTIETDLN